MIEDRWIRMKSTEKELLYTEKQRVIALYETFHLMDQREKEEELSELFLKLAQEEYAVAFCGHFSAGKSSLINALSNTGILPASPVPTSANIVKMKKGTPKAVVHLKNKDVVTFKHPYNIEEIKDLCKDADLVDSIEIYYEASGGNGANIAFYDTPGIDSTDPAHKKATENVVHLADLIFYVMDYNHILSETNIEFIQSLSQKGKSVRLIINQIDKHQESELSFNSFKENVFTSFESFGIKKEQIFFTSVKAPALSHNDLSALIAYIKKIELNKDHLLIEKTNSQLKYLVSDFIEDTEKDKLNLQIIEEKLNHLNNEKKSLLLETEKIEQNKKSKEEEIRTHFTKIIDSAQLMPYDTREKAGLFIEAAKKDFKVGLFFSKNKTEQERYQRKAAFQEKLQESVDAHINWHAQNYLNVLQKEFNVEFSQWKPVTLTEETLFSHVQSGLSSQGQGLLNYCESIAGEVKKLARQQMSQLIAFAMTILNEKNEEISLIHKNKTLQINNEIAVLNKDKEEALSWNQQKHELLNIISSDLYKIYSVDGYEKMFRSQYNEISIEEFKNNYKQKSQNPIVEHVNENTNIQKKERALAGSLAEETNRLFKASSLLKPLSGFSNLSEEMNALAERLEKRSFTAVLFGAFSAGKSSFANALFGESILPSSPNPTTAAINEIRKPDATNQHGTVIIEMKTEKEVLKEINAILKADYDDLSILENKSADDQSKLIQVFIQGYQAAKMQLGQSIKTDLSEIKAYAAVESNACFIRKIKVYYSCPITEKGLVLVDTPGANSIHSRHTEVAFEYMKHADIIIYLTYFNHAFSHADREFLIQLGRIKDTFTSDKMFFAINASDLANSEEDKKDVVNHVKGNLQTFGIRNPRLFSVSSKKELLGSDRDESGFEGFTSSLFHYVENDLEQVMILSAKTYESHAKNVVQNMIAETKLRLQQEDDYLEAVQKREEQLLNDCTNNISISKKQFNQEMKELLFYVKQRVLIRYHDFYKETIHPAAVQSSKAELNICISELYAKLDHDLQQEFRACSLRLDKWVQKNRSIKEDLVISKALDYQVNLKIPAENTEVYSTPSLTSSLSDHAGKDHKEWTSYFKNAKHFFEQGGSNDLKNELAKRVEKEVEQWMDNAEQVLDLHYDSVIKKSEAYSKESLFNQITVYFNELKKPGDLTGRIKALENCLYEMEQL
jgi:small GTP-binding protein